MKEKVKYLCKKKGITLKDLAATIGIARESLTRALDGNPTLSTIRGIAKALDVQPWELFSDTSTPEYALNGFIEYQGAIYRIQTFDDVKKLMDLRNDS